METKYRDHLIKKTSIRSIVFLVACSIITVTCFLCLLKWVSKVPTKPQDNYGKDTFRMFTAVSNLYAMVVDIIILTFAIEGIKQKSYSPPKWAVILQYSGVVCTTITMLTAFCIILPFHGIDAITSTNFYLHILCPVLQIVLFLLGENSQHIDFKFTFICEIPFYIYCVIYILMVYILKSWPDIYRLSSVAHPIVGCTAFIVIGFVVAFIVRIVFNKVFKYKADKLKQFIKETFENDKYSLLIEAYGLGTDYSKKYNKGEIKIPVWLFDIMCEMCDQITQKELCNSFLAGVYMSQK